MASPAERCHCFTIAERNTTDEFIANDCQAAVPFRSDASRPGAQPHWEIQISEVPNLS